MRFYAITSLLLLMISATMTSAHRQAEAEDPEAACHHRGLLRYNAYKAGTACEFQPKHMETVFHGTCQVKSGSDEMKCDVGTLPGQTGQTGQTSSGMYNSPSSAGSTSSLDSMGSPSSSGASMDGTGMGTGTGMSGMGTGSGGYRRRKRASFSRRTV
ncbi:hypothetical protein C8R42DRAFT_447560 [Lentinula raphanica]|nr:hypothetical protein C8R42DRAFT_447560 [Lentinula raphanica]